MNESRSEKFLIAVSLFVMFLFFYIEYNFYFDIRKDLGAKNKELKIALTTNKGIYAPDEPIQIIIHNYSPGGFVQNFSAPDLYIKSRHDFGKNYGVGLIERKDRDVWIAVEPIWRCNKPCFEKCDAYSEIDSRAARTYEWNQKIIKCDSKLAEESIIQAETGTYRAVIIVWNQRNNNYDQIYSNSFTIFAE
jgi:hypothetical protein